MAKFIRVKESAGDYTLINLNEIKYITKRGRLAEIITFSGFSFHVLMDDFDFFMDFLGDEKSITYSCKEEDWNKEQP